MTDETTQQPTTTETSLGASPRVGMPTIAKASSSNLMAQPRGGMRNASASSSSLLTKDNLSDGHLVIREFVPGEKDERGVKDICFTHFRSSCFAAVRYYIATHFQDLAFLAFIGFWVCRLWKWLLVIFLFHAYLFLKSRLEMEAYIRKDCADLRSVNATYMSDERSRFWVAEIVSGPAHASSTKLVGCIGLVPSREDSHCAKMVRLIVDASHRRMRIGSRLLAQMENYAFQQKYDSVRIYTNTLNPSHVKFVRQHGYAIIHIIRRGLMRGDLVTWHKSLVARTPISPLMPRSPEQMIEGAPTGAHEDRQKRGNVTEHRTGSGRGGSAALASSSESTTENKTAAKLHQHSAAQVVMD